MKRGGGEEKVGERNEGSGLVVLYVVHYLSLSLFAVSISALPWLFANDRRKTTQRQREGHRHKTVAANGTVSSTKADKIVA